ncbi:MAG TPA: hypothetical protein VM511_08990, partial [Luteolibacter sp.]|nr:hypothetical protein [Luteolibacter sp.]
NNHVPEVKPGDDWGDDAETPDIPGLSLPPKKEARRSSAKRKSALEDPRNHVPEVSEGDDWSDGEGVTILPKKRQSDEKPAGFHAPVADEEKGIEIGVKVIERPEPTEAKSGAKRLEVQEHVPKLLAPDAPPPPPKIVPKQVIERPEGEVAPAPGERFTRSAESEAWGTEKAIPTRWIVISVASIAVFVLAGVLVLPHIGWDREKSTRLNYSRLEVFDEGPKAASTDEMNLTEGIEEKAKKIVEAFVTATKVEDVLPLVRDRERLEPVIRQHWKPMEAGAHWLVPDNSEWSIRKSEKREYGYLAGMLPDITPFRFYIVQQGDKALLDWEASTGYSETPFAELVKGKGNGGVTRCFLSPGDLYGFSMPEAEYQCFRLGSPDAENAAWGYVRRDSPLFEKITSLFMQGAIPREILSEYPLTLTLGKAPEDSLPNQWLITEMLHMEWITP